ncbi:hypothetical protein VRRI112168_02870 [Vreelandella rituensis]|uniref:Uncharacterized protein n=1 Tax=Vreelandella rituensis TaxID=2282306 RepID=A0A368UAX4_9GAMM|nr:hypothetical protein [Halomonas rituensis]RCV93687.1 hypothetical protein DU506_00590 [Halomonas rituensis]
MRDTNSETQNNSQTTLMGETYSPAVEAAIEKASHIDDKTSDAFNEALFQVQQLMGVDDGGVASVMFSGPDEDWREATPAQRLVELHAYIAAEKDYL